MLWEFGFWETVRILLAWFLLAFLPGRALLRFTSWKNEDPLQTAAVSLGFSVSLVSLLFLLGFFFSQPVGPLFLWIALGVMGALWLLFPERGALVLRETGRGSGILILCVLTGLFWRFFQVKELVLPAWVDPLHHVTIVRKMIESGGIPASLEPYLPIPFYYHFSFHAFCTGFACLAGVPAEAAVFMTGQAFNALVALSLFRFFVVVSADRWISAVAALLTVFFMQMPGYYVSWGRYTLLTGLVLLPLAMAEVERLRREPCHKSAVRLCLLTAGVLLAHFFAGFLLALYVAICFFSVLVNKDRSMKDKRTFALLFSAAVGTGLLLAAPWLHRMWVMGNLYVRVGATLPRDSIDQVFFPNYGSYLIYLLGPLRVHLLEAAALAGLGLAWCRKDLRVFAAWATLLCLGAMPWGIRLNPLRPDHIVIVLFIPAVFFFSLLLANGKRFLGQRWNPLAAERTILVLVMAMILVGVRQTRTIVNRETILAEKEDLLALRWLQANVPREARFLVNTTPWEWGSFRGADGGAWILPLTGRWTIAPPPLFFLGDPAYVLHTRQVAQKTSQMTGCDSQLAALLQQEKISHVYLGVKQGSLRPEALDNCSFLRTLYRQGEVRIFRVDLEAAGGSQ